MDAIRWEHIITATPGQSLQDAYAVLRDQERYDWGHNGRTGTAADHEHAVDIHNDSWEPTHGPVTEARARELVEEHGYQECACAIELRTAPGEPRRWLVFGKSYV